jgi:DNA polymerase-4
MGVFFHIDLDAFFAAVEVLDRPELRGKPVVVGAAESRRGVVSTCSYEARRYGVRSAMPIAEARRLCPEAVFLPVRMARYAELSAHVMAVFGDYTPELIRVSIDEASLDMSGTERLWGPTEEAARSIKRRVADETGLSISIGAAPNRYLAKIASGLRKPDGLVIVAPGEEESFAAALSLDQLWGAGAKTRARLVELGIDTVERLRAVPEAALARVMGKSGAAFLTAAARGRDPGIYGQEPKSRSISTESTFEYDVRDRMSLEAALLGMAEELCARLYEEGLASRTIQLKLRFADFETTLARETKDAPFSSSSGVYEAALQLLDRRWDGRPLRLIGLGLVNIGAEGAKQGSLFDDERDAAARKAAAVERAVFDAAHRGLGPITRARLVKPPSGKEPKL